MIYIWTDGSVLNKSHDKGGYGIVIIHNKEVKEFFGGQYISTTSARMEIRAIIEALKIVKRDYIDQEITLYSDNEYCVKTWMQKWYVKWEKEEWKNRLNADLWQEFLQVIRSFRNPNDITFFHVKGHSGNKYNEICDQLARKGSQLLTTITDREEDDNRLINSNDFHDLDHTEDMFSIY